MSLPLSPLPAELLGDARGSLAEERSICSAARRVCQPLSGQQVAQASDGSQQLLQAEGRGSSQRATPQPPIRFSPSLTASSRFSSILVSFLFYFFTFAF